MTREEAKELLPIVQAFAEGKTIQYRVSPSFPRLNNHDISYVKEWFDIDEDKCDGFSCDGTIDYRIKPEPKYRPFKTKEECWNEMLKHQPFGWITSKKTDNYVFIDYVGELNSCVCISFTAGESECYPAEMLFDKYKFVDGTPFGMCDD